MRSAVRTICVAGCSMLFLLGSSFAEEGKAPEVLYQKGLYLETAKLKEKASKKIISLVRFTNADLNEFILFLIKQTEINIVVDEFIFLDKSINTRVTCYLQNMSLLKILDAILQPKGLDYVFTKNYIWISTKDKTTDINVSGRK